MNTSAKIIKLSVPCCDGKVSVEAALRGRRSVRNYRDEPVELGKVSQLLWAAQGISRSGGYRTCPSAGALYPLELHVVAGRVDELPTGIYRYDCANHELSPESEGDARPNLARAALGQSMIFMAPVTIAISGIFERSMHKYGDRGIRYVYMEAGHAAQNIHLQVVSLNLGTVIVGAFRDDQVKSALRLRPDESPLLLMPVGKL
jgi:SagB-type dehydrogenase family enzyme